MSPELNALVEKVARAIWATREDAFPGRVRLSWEASTQIARDSATADALVAIRAVAEETSEASEAMTDAGGLAHYRKRVDAGSPWPAEQADDGGGPMGYAWRAMHTASVLGEALRDDR